MSNGEKFFSLTCPCGATLQATMKRLLESETMVCPNCEKDLLIDALKQAATSWKDAKKALKIMGSSVKKSKEELGLIISPPDLF